MARYLNPQNDLVFKKVFGEHPDLLTSFLNALLPLDEDRQIVSIEYLSTENVPEIPEFKYSIVDVRCRDQKGRHFIVEMQMSWPRHYIQRFLFNTASVYVRQLQRGAEYRHLSPLYGLSLITEKFSEETDCFHHYQLTHSKNHTKLDDIHLVLLELPKFMPTTRREKKLTALWLRFMTEVNEKNHQIDPALEEVPEIKKALSLVEEAAYTRAELEAYDRNWDAIRTESMLMDDKFEDGREQGLVQGRLEEREKMVKNLLLKSFDINMIAEITGLDLEIILKIKDKTLND